MGATGVHWIGARIPLFFYFGLGLGGLIYIYSVFSCTCTFLSFFPVHGWIVVSWFFLLFFASFEWMDMDIWFQWVGDYSPPPSFFFALIFSSSFRARRGRILSGSDQFCSVLISLIGQPFAKTTYFLLCTAHILSILSTFSPHTITSLYLSAR